MLSEPYLIVIANPLTFILAPDIASVRLQLNAEDFALEQSGIPILNKISASAFVYMGLELEETQYVHVLFE